MASLKRLCQIRPRAVEDLTGIWHYTAGTWSTAQADHYYHLIEQKIQELADRPEIAQRYPRKPGLYKHLVGSHMIFFRLTSDSIIVVRVLHAAQDFERHL